MSRVSRARSTRYHVFVLSLWEEGGSVVGDKAAWRCSLEGAQTAERKGFKSLEELMTYLEAWTRNSPDEGPILPSTQGGAVSL